MDTQTFRINNEKYTKEVIIDLEEIEKISDLEEKWSEVDRAWRKHSQKFKELKDNKPKDHLGYFPWSDLGKYEKEIKKLKELKEEVLQKCSEIREHKKSGTNDKKENKANFSEKQNQKKQKENHICWECHKTDSKKWYINQQTGLEFCSQSCNLEHNAELCENCIQKCLKYENGIPVNFQSFYKDNEKKTGTLCFICKQKQRKSLESKLERLQQDQKEDKKERERLKKLIESDDDKKDLDDANIDNPNSNNITIERERERERESKSILSNSNSAPKSLTWNKIPLTPKTKSN